VTAAVEKLAVIALVAMTAIAVLRRRPRGGQRARAAVTAGVLVLTPTLLLIDLWHNPHVTHLRHHPLLGIGAALAMLALVIALAALIAKRPSALPVLVVLALPFRLPLAIGGSTVNLLVPLYAVIAAGTLANLRSGLAGSIEGADAEAPESISAARAVLSPRGLEWILLASVLLYAVQATYSNDFSKGLENVVFFYVPFALLFALLRDVRWTVTLLLTCLKVAAALAVIFAAIGFVEYQRQQLFLNPRLVQANEYGGYFRVNSVFFDPNIYGRFLALVMIALAVVVLSAPTRRAVLGLAVVLLWLWAGLLTSLSESSMAALLLGLAVLAAWRWDTVTTLLVAGAIVVGATAFVLAAPPSAHLGLSGEGASANTATSGRASLVSGGLSLFADRPLVGYGSGSFAVEYRRHHRTTEEVSVSASHTIPITVAAEQGIAGLAVYALLLASTLWVLFAGAWRSPARVAVVACFAALVLHTWAYADFLEDPTTWTLLAIGVALARATAKNQGLAGAGEWSRQGAAARGEAAHGAAPTLA
jgi:O-antigen ligase